MAKPTVAQRILVHLSLFSRFREEYECPNEVTQKGVSSALGLSRSHIALELKKLLEEGYVESRLAHVKGARSRRKVYFLETSGEGIAASLRLKARSVEARWIDPEGETHLGVGAELLQLSRSLERPMTGVYEGVLAGEVVDLRETKLAPSAAPTPILIGRAKELEQLRAWLVDGPPMMILTGLPGIGKTLLASALFHDVEDSIWIQVFPFHTAYSLLSSIAHGLASRGRARLLSYLRRTPPDLAEARMLISREASDMLLIFDDASSTPDASLLRLFLDDPPSGCKALLTARKWPEFLRADDLALDKVRGMRLGGLTLGDSRELLLGFGRSELDVERIYEATRGHPLLLRLSAATSGQVSEAEVEASFLNEVLRELDHREEEILARASVFRRPFPGKALGRVGFRTLRSLEAAGLITYSGGRYQVHDILAPLIRKHSGDALTEGHLRAARYWNSEGEWLEEMHHRAAAHPSPQLVNVLEMRMDDILQQGKAEELLELLKELPPTDGGRLHYLRARALDYLGKWTQALIGLEEGMERATPELRISMLLLRGRLHSKRGELDEAKNAFDEAAELSDQEGRDLELGRARYGLGIVRRKMGDMKKAVDCMKRAIEIFEAAGAEAELGRAQMEMGVIRLQAERPEEAVEWFRRSMSLLSSGLVDSAYLHNNLGIAYSKLSLGEKSLRAFEESIRLAEEAGMARAQGYALANAADLYIEFGKVDRAFEYCERSLRIFRQLEDPVMISACFANQAKAQRATGNLEAAERLYNESLRTLERTKAPYSLAARWLEVSDLYEEMGEAVRARDFRTRALGVLREDRTPPTRV